MCVSGLIKVMEQKIFSPCLSWPTGQDNREYSRHEMVYYSTLSFKSPSFRICFPTQIRGLDKKMGNLHVTRLLSKVSTSSSVQETKGRGCAELLSGISGIWGSIISVTLDFGQPRTFTPCKFRRSPPACWPPNMSNYAPPLPHFVVQLSIKRNMTSRWKTMRPRGGYEQI